jgi:hypothetical protein
MWLPPRRECRMDDACDTDRGGCTVVQPPGIVTAR